MNRNKQENLSLSRQFAAAAVGVGAGIAAAFGANEVMTMMVGDNYTASVSAFLINLSSLYAVAGATTAYVEHKLQPAPKL